MLKRQIVSKLVLGGLLSLSVVACTSYQAKPIPDAAASDFLGRYEVDGFVFAGVLPAGSEYVERHFGRDVMAWDLVPVTIYVENRSAEFNFEVRVQDIKLTLADGTKFERVSAVEVAEIAS